MCVCMYVCLYVCMSVCMYVYMYACMYVCMYVWMYVCLHTCIRGTNPSTVECSPKAYSQHATLAATSPITHPERPSTQYLKFLVPETIQFMVFGIRDLRYWVLGPPWSGLSTIISGSWAKQWLSVWDRWGLPQLKGRAGALFYAVHWVSWV